MSSWVNRTVLSGSSTAANGTNAHTCTFTAASSGNFLVAIVAGAVTFTTPTGWTLLQSAVGGSGLYVFTKTASAGESSFTTTHNGTNYAILGIVYEFYTGTAANGTAGTNNAVAATATSPSATGLTGTYTRIATRSWTISTGYTSGATTWRTPTVEDYDAYIPSGSQDGVTLSVAYDDGATGTSFSPDSDQIIQPSNLGNGCAISFALTVVTPATGGLVPIAWYYTT